jgi:hypothetical protein
VGNRTITDEFVRHVADDLRARYGLDDQHLRALGTRLAQFVGARPAEIRELAQRVIREHRDAIDRLAE